VAGQARTTLLRFAVRLTPKGGRDAVEGWAQGADGKRYLRARVAVAPEDGKANQALIVLLARALGVPKSKLRIVSGSASRLKMIEMDGDGDAVAARLDSLGTPQ
jgi:uncharacterized protein YggU (UPF0235/DUF167 family)